MFSLGLIVRLSDIAIAPLDVVRSTRDYLSDLTTPTLRLGVTGLARAGKTVFITSMIRNLIQGGRLPFLAAYAEGRVVGAVLAPQPDDAIPRFDYERHIEALTAASPAWPESTRAISELRVTITYWSGQWMGRAMGQRKLHIDIVDYPGEWLLDLPMLDQTYAQWSAEAMNLARSALRASSATMWLADVAGLDAAAPADEVVAIGAAASFTSYLKGARENEPATVGPGRFLMPGDYEGSPLLAFAPLDIAADAPLARGSLAAMMARRYDSYRQHLVRPFFRDNFSRLDRQIVLVDVLSALDRGADAVDDLSRAMGAALIAFRPGSRGWLSVFLPSRIDRIVFAATKADHLPASSHDRLEATLGLIVENAARRAQTAGSEIKSMALAALRATTEARAKHNGDVLACIKGTPLQGERLGNRVFDGVSEIALFPGDLDVDPHAALARARRASAGTNELGVSVLRFRPPRLQPEATSIEPQAWPHVRLDRALEHLLGDHLA